MSDAGTLAGIQKDGSILVGHPSGIKTAHRVNWVRPYKKGALLSLREVTDRNLAQALVGCELLIHKNELPGLEDGVYYWFDLIGMQVCEEDDRVIGRITSIIETGSNDVYVVKDKKGAETLVPALGHVVLDVNVKNKTMRVRLPDGL